MSRRRCAWLWFFIVYFILVDYHPVRIANAKLRARTISRKAFACMCVRVRVRVCARVHVSLRIHVTGPRRARCNDRGYYQ